MTYYDLFTQGPSVYIPVLVISLLITLITYSSFPLLYARLKKKPTTAKKYRWKCYGFNIIPMVFFFLLSDKPSPWAYILWTSVFVASGLKTLKRRNVLVDSVSPVQVQSTIPSSDSGSEYTGKYQQSSVADSSSTNHSKKKQCYCKHCGDAIDQSTKQCTNCGKQYFRLPAIKMTRLAVIGVIIISIVIVSLGVYSTVQYQNQVAQLNLKISDLEAELDSTNDLVSELQEKYRKKFSEAYDLSTQNKKLQNEITAMERVYDFCNDHVVVVSDDGTRKYHKIQCIYFDDSYFWAYNTEKAQQLGYTPCSFCFSRYFDSLTN